jgi:cytochrome c biogenesis protein CcmG/thiol:disulfide interchange protein DsbE
MNRSALPLIGFLLLVALLAVGLTLNPREVPSPFVGKPAPAFSLPSLHQPEKLIAPADMKGKVWLLNVWASWCVSCRAEHDVVSKLARTGEVKIVGLNYKDQRADALNWLKRFGDPYVASAMDGLGDTGIDWGVYGVPETFVIDQQGLIQYKHIGPITDKSVEEIIMPLVRKLNGAAS